MPHSPLAVTNYFKIINFLLEQVRGKNRNREKLFVAKKKKQGGREKYGNKKRKRVESKLEN